MPTALDVITGALQDLGQVQAGEALDADDAVDAFSALNDLADALSAERLWLYTIGRTAHTLVSGTASYTIGSGGVINIDRPIWIDRAGLILDTTASTPVETPIAVYTDVEWALVRSKTLAGSPAQGIYYDHSWSAGLGLISPWPVPDVATTQLVIYAPSVSVGQFADLSTTTYTFPPGYRRAIRKLLAVELGPAYGVAVSDDLKQAAREAHALVTRSNVRPLPLQYDPAFRSPTVGRWNITTDQYPGPVR